MSNKNSNAVSQIAAKKTIMPKNKKAIAAWIIGAAALATAIVLVLVFAFDLGPVRPIESTEEQARVVGTVAGFEVRYEELLYVTSINRVSLDVKYGKYDTLSADDKKAYDDELKALVMDDIKSNYAILSLCREYGVDTDSKEARDFVNDSIESLVDEIGGKGKYREWLEKNHLTDAFLRLMYKVSYLEGALVQKLTEGGKEIKYSEANLGEFVNFVLEDESYVKVIHAFYPKDWSYSNGKSAQQNAAAAFEEIQSAVTKSDRFSKMKSAIGQAPFVSGYSVMGSDYYVTYGQMHEDYESIAFSLGEYEASSVLELEEGYYILMSVPKEKDEIGPRAVEFLTNYRYAVLKRLADEEREQISFVGNEYFGTLELANIK